MVIVDTNVILRHVLQDHAEHAARADAFFQPVMRGERQVWISDAVVGECVYVLAGFYRVPRRDVVASLLGVLNYRGVTMDRWRPVKIALETYGSTKLDFVDSLLLALSRSTGWELFSFDKKLGD